MPVLIGILSNMRSSADPVVLPIPVWPIDLPQRFQQSGFSQKEADGRIKTTTDFGPGKMRLRYSLSPRHVSGSFYGWQNDKARLGRFYYETTNRGVTPFSMPDQIIDSIPLTSSGGSRLTTAAGGHILTSEHNLVRFEEPPQEQCLGAAFVLSLNLTLLP